MQWGIKWHLKSDIINFKSSEVAIHKLKYHYDDKKALYFQIAIFNLLFEEGIKNGWMDEWFIVGILLSNILLAWSEDCK